MTRFLFKNLKGVDHLEGNTAKDLKDRYKGTSRDWLQLAQNRFSDGFLCKGITLQVSQKVGHLLTS